jgi:spermidine synthase
VRVFAIASFHHFAYMAIGVAMAGLGAAGTVLAVRRPPPERIPAWLAWSTGAAALALVAAPALASRLAFDPARLAWDAGEWVRLALLSALLALPFFGAALAILLALTASADRPGAMYGASFAGAACGVTLAIAVLWVAPPERALALPAALTAAAALAAVRDAGGRPVRALTWFAAGAALLAWLVPPWRFSITSYKALPQIEAYPGAVRIAERWSPVGWVVALQAPAFRYAPGLSLVYDGAFPRQMALLLDGDLAGAVSAWATPEHARAFTSALPATLPYALDEAGAVLVLGAGDGSGVQTALAQGAERVVAVELSGELSRLAQDRIARDRAAGRRVEWVTADARGYVARTGERFDLITIGASGGLGGAAAGLHALNEDFLHTVDAYQAYLRRLTDHGVLAITRWMTLPPRAPVRTILTAAEALRRERPAALARGLVVARSWATATVLVKPSGFTPDEVAALRRWAESRQMDLDWHPGLAQPEARFNLLDEPTLFLAATAAAGGAALAGRFAEDFPFDVAPVTDARPYPHQFLRANRLPGFFAAGRGRWLPFAEWAYMALMATLALSVVLGTLLLALPLAARPAAARSAPQTALLGYFACIGLAYLAAEIAAIQQLQVLLGHPVYAVAATLAAFLLASGAGSTWSDRLPAQRASALLLALAVVLGVCAALLLPLAHMLQGTSLAARAAAGAVAVAAPALLMGIPFPVGLRCLAGAVPERVAWAWAANGYASVVAAPLAALVAVEAGSRALFLLAGALYTVAGGIVWSRRSPA